MRTVPLLKSDRYAWDVLKEWVESHDGGMGFCQQTVNYRVTQMGKRILDRRLIPHAFRSYCATQLAKRTKGDIYAMMNFMGWDTPTVAMRYVHAAGIAAEKALDEWRLREIGVA